MREQNGVPIAIVGQAFPYTPIANPRYFVPDWTFGIREQELQKVVDEVRAKGAQVVVLLSHNGMDVDLKLASRVRGIDAILGGHTHDGVPRPSIVANPGGKTLVTNAGCNGKFLARARLRRQERQRRGFPLQAAAGVREPAARAKRHGGAHRQECAHRTSSGCGEKLAVTEGLLYRRGNFNGSFDQLILDALDGGKGRRDRVLAGLSLGHDAASRAADHARARDGPDGDHLSVRRRSTN